MAETDFFTILDCVDSSNNYAMGQVHAGLAKHGQAWFAKEQTGGKGQRGKTWETGKNENIALSIAVVPAGLETVHQFRLSVAVSLASFDLFYKIAGEGTSIKWPNDIYWRDRKAGGILIENVLQGNSWKFAVIGIGINVNQETFNAELNNATSLKTITGNEYDPIELAEELYRNVMQRINSIHDSDFEVMLKEYNRRLYMLGQEVKLKKGDIITEEKISGVSQTGKLQTTNTEYNFGEVEWLLSLKASGFQNGSLPETSFE